ncbi:MAG TPA: hypothetical protein VG709_07225, partial [Actinomycetota bacterium]|nr:hypothetical protein [Actinomycetota bacterium]
RRRLLRGIPRVLGLLARERFRRMVVVVYRSRLAPRVRWGRRGMVVGERQRRQLPSGAPANLVLVGVPGGRGAVSGQPPTQAARRSASGCRPRAGT